MRRVDFKTRLMRDLKKMARRGKSTNKFLVMIGLIAAGTPLPEKAKLHKLSGQYEGLWECHIESDWLLIFDITDREVILYRTGTHSDLFE